MIGPRAIRLVVLAFGAAVTVSLATTAAQVTWRFAGDGGAPLPPAPAIAQPAPAAPDIGPILALAPFGEPTREPALAAAAETSLNLTLEGVVLARPAARSSAFISAPGEPGAYFRVGDEIPGGAVIESVERDHVVLLIGTRRETLSFPDSGAAAIKARGVATMRALLPESVRGEAPSPERAQPIPIADRPAPDEVIDDYRRRIAANPQTVLDDLGLAVVAEGYRIGAQAPQSVRRAGFQAGDVVTAVNGVSVGEIEADRQLFEDIAAAGSARVEIMRGDRIVTLSFPLR
ncbi:MAG: type II secretion system protein N [Maricaulaceae bacterium]|jgi:general secretion pathway protein C